MSISVYDLNTHLHANRPIPPGAAKATIKTSHVVTTHRTSRMVAHRPIYALAARVELRRGISSRFQLAARFACGSASESVVPVADASDLPLCAKCERVVSNEPDTWSIYAYENEDGEALYVGQTIDLAARDQSHRTDRRSAAWYGLAVRRRVLSIHDSRRDANAAEKAAINDLRPIYNRQHNSHLRVVS